MKLKMFNFRNTPSGDHRYCDHCGKFYYTADESRFKKFTCEHCGHKNESIPFYLWFRPISVCAACLIPLPFIVGITYELLGRQQPFSDGWFAFWGIGLVFCFWNEIRASMLRQLKE